MLTTFIACECAEGSARIRTTYFYHISARESSRHCRRESGSQEENKRERKRGDEIHWGSSEKEGAGINCPCWGGAGDAPYTVAAAPTSRHRFLQQRTNRKQFAFPVERRSGDVCGCQTHVCRSQVRWREQLRSSRAMISLSSSCGILFSQCQLLIRNKG